MSPTNPAYVASPAKVTYPAGNSGVQSGKRRGVSVKSSQASERKQVFNYDDLLVKASIFL